MTRRRMALAQPVRINTSTSLQQTGQSLVLFGLLFSAVTGFSLPALSDRFLYDTAEKAYQAGDCATAIANFERVIDGWRLIDLDRKVPSATQKQAECQALQAAQTAQSEASFGIAIARHAEFLAAYPESPLNTIARSQVTRLFQQVAPEAIAQPESCPHLPQLQRQGLIPPKQLPDLYQVCGFIPGAVIQDEPAL